MKIDFDGLQAFVVVTELGSFTKAAERLSITQTALSRRVQRLESLLGQRLLERTTRRVALTATGTEYLGQARAMVREMVAVFSQMRGAARQARASFSLACVPTMVAFLLPDLIQRYTEHHPDHRIRLTDATSQEVREAVLNGQAEIGIAVQGERNPRLIETHLFDDPLRFFCRRDHPLSKKSLVSWSDLSTTHLIVVSSQRATRVFMNYQLAKRGLSVSGAYEVQHHSTAASLVAAGVGCAILPASCIDTSDRRQLVSVPLGNPVVKRKVLLIQRKGAELSEPAARFADLLRRRA